MAKFRIGDKVIRIGTSGSIKVGALGRVSRIENGDTYVKWDSHRTEQAYSHETKDLELHVAPLVLTVDKAIDTYRQACTDFEAAQLAVEKAKAAVQDARFNLRDALDGES